MPNTTAYNVCDLNLIYNSSYEYFLPKEELERFLSGKAFNNSKVYSVEESQNLYHDINDIYQQIIETEPTKQKLAIITAGAPGAGKTTLLQQEIDKNHLQNLNYAYICPDDVCLKNQSKTFQADLKTSPTQSRASKQNAYNKWRPASNAASHLILGNLIRENYAFYYGSTSTSPLTSDLFKFLKQEDYKIKLIHVSALNEVRYNSIQERDQTFVQTTAEDVKEKGLLLPQRIHDTFLKYVDEIEFYYRSDVKENACLAATWIHLESHLQMQPVLKIIDQEAYDIIKTIHNEVIKILDRSDLEWESIIENSLK
jgi:Zeta toxin